MKNCLSCIVLILLFETSLLFGQTNSAALPFVLRSPSAGFSGIGEVTVGLETTNPFALFWNPAHLGQQSLNNWGAIGFSSNNATSSLLPDDLTYTTQVFQGGINFSKYYDIPFGLSFGIAYSNVSNELGEFIIWGMGPDDPLVFHAEEISDQYSFGVGLDFDWIQTSFGFTSKWIESNLFPIDFYGNGRNGKANVRTSDWGLFFQVPVHELVPFLREAKFTLVDTYRPFFHAGYGYAKNNFDDGKVWYIDEAQADPLPRTVRQGLGIHAGVRSENEGEAWVPFSFRLGIDASDLLVNRWGEIIDTTGGNSTVVREPGWEYDTESELNFFNDFILGTSDEQIEKRKGWEVSVLEFFSYRRGNMVDPLGRRDIATEGFGFRLKGAFKLLQFVVTGKIEHPTAQWIFKHVDFWYNESTGSSDFSLDDGHTYRDFVFVLKN